ncbi:glycogen synthase GlgA [Sphingobium aquiterrae]|uniref:glycogen synthase GlgA n=1 Tax=Sphingobium aquiterrae TaxID=2038656 RepID=UPI003018B094
MRRPVKLLSIASEIHPLVKTGGLADVAGALPAALAVQGIAVRTLLPGYPGVMAAIAAGGGKGRRVHRYADLFGAPAVIVAVKHGALDLLILDSPALFDRPGSPYGASADRAWDDNWRRFAALARAGADIAAGALRGWRPDVVHAHDWQAALALAYMRYGPAAAPDVPGVVTIHNLAFQGVFGREVFDRLGLPPEAWSVDGVEYYGSVGFLKAGISCAHAITTVSPTYAEEIRTPAHGMGLDGLLESRADRLHGILNGIDREEWNPATDPAIARPFTARALSAREGNRRLLAERFGLARDHGPLFVVVSRLTWQKGMDLLADAVDDLVAMGGRLALLGSGDQALEGAFLAAADRHRGRAGGRVGVRIGYDEALAHLLQAGGDAILVPSRFEPCGLTQLYALRYGCVPVVARVGGLADTVIDANEAATRAGVATGIQFAPGDGHALRRAIKRTIALYHDRPQWSAMQRAGMRADFGWEASAARYADLFRSLLA